MCCCAKKLAVLLLYVFNIGFFIFGAVSLGLGLFVLLDRTRFLSVLTKVPGSGSYDVDEVLSSASYLEMAAYILIAVGGFIFLIAFCGLCGAKRENRILLTVYAVLVGIILIIELTAGILAVFWGDDVEKYLQSFLLDLVVTYYSGAYLAWNNVITQSTDATGVSDAIDFAQVYFDCCGINNYTDFQLYATNWPGEYNVTSGGSISTVNAVVPFTCCKMTGAGDWPGNTDNVAFVDLNDCITTASSNSTNLDSCYDTMKDTFLKYSTILTYIGILIALTEVLGIICAVIVIKANNKVADN